MTARKLSRSMLSRRIASNAARDPVNRWTMTTIRVEKPTYTALICAIAEEKFPFFHRSSSGRTFALLPNVLVNGGPAQSLMKAIRS